MARSVSLPGRPAYLSVLPDFLFRDDERASRYVVKTVLLSVAGTVLLLLLTMPFVSTEGAPQAPVDGWSSIVLIVVVAPLFETLLMILPLFLAKGLFGAGPAAVASAALWGVLHSLQAPPSGLIIWWPFLLMSIAI